MKKFLIENKRNIILILASVIIIAVAYLTIHCPIRFLTGLSCPGCGMTRALFAFLRLDFKKAFYYHPAIFIMPLAAVIFIFRSKFTAKKYNLLLAFFVIILAVIYIYRIIIGNEIVAFDIENGLIYKIFQHIF